jgi:hypothetical protein
MSRRLPVISCLVAALAISQVQGQAPTPAPAQKAALRRAAKPPAGIVIPDDVRKELTEKLLPLERAINELAQSKDPNVQNLLADVQIFYKAVHDGLEYNEMYTYDSDAKSPVPLARRTIEQGLERARQLKEGKPRWTSQTGLVPRGYVSKIDGSIQPYGLIVPESYVPTGSQKYRLDTWLHGMHDTLSELDFLKRRTNERGEFQPKDTIVLHPYGRYLNVYRFAGEMDVLEGIEAVKNQYSIDEDRIAMRGFSLGGAGCWQLGVHYSDRFFAMNVGAGWVEAAAFRGMGPSSMSPWEKTLRRWYECPDLAVNLYNLPTVVYCGEFDGQKEAGFRMARAAKEHGIEIVNLIAPNTSHEFRPDYRDEVERRMTSLALKGRDRAPRKVKLATFTLKYNRMHWVTIDGLDQHWQPTRVDAEYVDGGRVTVATSNVSALTLNFPAGWAPFDFTEPVSVSINGQTLTGPRPLSDRSWTCTMHREASVWSLDPPVDSLRGCDLRLTGPVRNLNQLPARGKDMIVVGSVADVLNFRVFDGAGKKVVDTDEKKLTEQSRQIQDLRSHLAGFGPRRAPTRTEKDWILAAVTSIVGYTRPMAAEPLRKKHDLQGPIDDAFMDTFMFVRPTGKFANPAVETWVRGELDRAITTWRLHYRGQARVKDDRDVTAADIASANLVLWGDASSNAVLAKIAGKLPIGWNDREVIVGDQRFPADHHVPSLIHPNPLNPERYVVLNSSFTYREYEYSRHPIQFSKLPDWAIVDLTTPADDRYPGKIVTAGFFDEHWMLKPASK